MNPIGRFLRWLAAIAAPEPDPFRPYGFCVLCGARRPTETLEPTEGGLLCAICRTTNKSNSTTARTWTNARSAKPN